MADVTNLSGVISALGVFVNRGTTAAPDWEYMCAMNARAMNVTRGEQTTTIVAACGPAAPVETWRNAGALDWNVTGEAALELETFDFCRQWIMDGTQKNVRIVFYKGPKEALVAHGYFQGLAVLLEYPVSQPDADNIPTANLSISKGAGTLTWATGAPTS